MSDIDPNTGLLALPGEDFWRVQVFETNYRGLRYKIIRMLVTEVKTPWIIEYFTGKKTRKIITESGTHWTLFYHDENLFAASRQAWEFGESRVRDQQMKEEQRAMASTLVGDYPPKKYEGAR